VRPVAATPLIGALEHGDRSLTPQAFAFPCAAPLILLLAKPPHADVAAL